MEAVALNRLMVLPLTIFYMPHYLPRLIKIVLPHVSDPAEEPSPVDGDPAELLHLREPGHPAAAIVVGYPFLGSIPTRRRPWLAVRRRRREQYLFELL